MSAESKAGAISPSSIQTTTLFVYFRVATQRFRLPAAAVERVADVGPVNGLPRLPPVVLGICSDRGRVLTVIDAARLLGVSPLSDDKGLPRLLVLTTSDSALALRVDAVESIQTAEEETITDENQEVGPEGATELSIQLLLARLAEVNLQDNGAILKPIVR